MFQKLVFKYLLLSIFLIFIVQTDLFSQLENDYTPIQQKGEIPYDYIKKLKGDVKIKYRNSERINKLQRDQFKDATKYSISQVFQKGDIYFNDPMTEYVRKVGDQLLYGSDLAIDIRFFVSRYTTTNATSWQDGTIIVNIGLLSKIENEAQLAFAMAHEVSHYIQQHPYKQYADFVKKEETTNSTKAYIYHYNKALHYEIEADSIAIKLLRKANYDYEEGIKVLKTIKGEMQRLSPNFPNYLSSDKYTIDQEKLCKAIQYYDYMERPKNRSIKPTDARQIKFQRTIKKLKPNTELKQYILSRRLFEKVNQIAKFEVVEQTFNDLQHLLSSYEALQLLEKFPNNKYLQIKIAENLFELKSYNDLGVLVNVFEKQRKTRDDGFANFCCFINKLTKDDLKKMTIGFTQKLYKKHPSDERMLIIMAKTLEDGYGLENAKSYYRRYVISFPDGEHCIMAKEKLGEK